MVLAITLFVRGLILRGILLSKKQAADQQLTDTAKQNLKVVTAALLHIVTPMYRQLPKRRDNQDHLLDEEKVNGIFLIFGSNEIPNVTLSNDSL